MQVEQAISGSTERIEATLNGTTKVVKDASQEALAEAFGIESVKNLSNIFTVEHIREGEVIDSQEIANGVTLEGFNHMLNNVFSGEADKAGWYIGLIDSTGFTAVAEADTMASHAGWVEFQTYNEAARPAFVPTTSSAKSITSSGVQTYTIGTVTGQNIEGVFVTDSATKGGTTGFLWSTALYASAKTVVTGDTFRITYTLNLGN